MIKGIDAQVMTNRATEYTKDVSSHLRRDELSNEFANRLNQTQSEAEMRTVTETEAARGSRVNADDEGGGNQGGSSPGKRREKDKDEDEADEYIRPGLPSVGITEHRVLDIEV